jgi:hypothetical protein
MWNRQCTDVPWIHRLEVTVLTVMKELGRLSRLFVTFLQLKKIYFPCIIKTYVRQIYEPQIQMYITG